ncbi:restriction endonuclease subunit S [Novosphingobium sp. P6W]|uniref:restriction endonuclease subunit S n=1 Tax=Novosphingobium sp. P6W TaxID=1609758 RepID=UPI0006977129|nr:restriction endonuclease subunit S [Novosphingobium sp. P6W]AXB77872.1 restriction endonuclease subunit S [Novosphingobium sp. P6W]
MTDVVEMTRVTSDLPDGWRSVPFSALADYVNGRAFKPEDWGTKGLPIIRIAQITNPNAEANFFDGEVDPRNLIDSDDLIFSWSATLAVMRWTKGPAILNQHLFKVTPKKGVDRDWLRYRLEASMPDLADEAHGTTMKHIRKGTLSSKTTFVPSLDEQRRIAEVLRSVDEAIAASQATLNQSEVALSALSDELFAAAMPGVGNEWRQYALEDMLDNIIDYRGVPPPKADSGIPLLTAKNVRFGYLDFEPREFIAAHDFDSWMRRGLPSAGDIMFTTEAPLGNVAEFPDIKAALGQRTLTLVPKPGALDAKFLKWLLLSKPVQALIWSHATGSTAKGIKQRTFRKLKFGFPTLHEQVRIAEVMEDIGAARDAAKRSNEAYAVMKAHLMSDLLSGQVRVPV